MSVRRTLAITGWIGPGVGGWQCRQTPNPATIRDVAALAGASISSFSYALNGVRAVPEELRAQVAEAVAAAGYTPNSVARPLKRAKNHTAGADRHHRKCRARD